MLIGSVSNIPKQKYGNENILFNKKITFFSVIAGIFTGILPGTTNSTGALLFPVEDQKDFLYYVSGINTSSMIISLYTFFILNKTRNGILITIKQIMENIIIIFDIYLFILFLGIILIVGSISIFIAPIISKNIILLFRKINYNILKNIIIIFLIVLSFIFDSFYGIIAIITTTSLSIMSQYLNLKRSLLLGSLLINLLILYFL